MKKFKKIFLETEPKPIDDSSLEIFKSYPSMIPVDTVVAMYKWILQTGGYSEEKRIFRDFLVGISSEHIMQNLEGQYARH